MLQARGCAPDGVRAIRRQREVPERNWIYLFHQHLDWEAVLARHPEVARDHEDPQVILDESLQFAQDLYFISH